MSQAPELPRAIRDFVEGTNAGDRERFLSAFAADAYLNDWGREFHGRDGVASWDGTDNIGRQAQFSMHALVPGERPGTYRLRLTVGGNGYNGPGDFEIELDDDGLIVRLVIG
jgi:hypothetical protein